ncbi:hypothetical protein [Nocardioides sp.]|uniref:hypothetical protein n=1 Tax=Nocardioides sp. TaxID=35761 RepID=UPI001A33AB51|nr:hypothetical protein [Nocardioides sp.]MBJ7358496.1 hypothetical protein [Nocardioides sp.]
MKTISRPRRAVAAVLGTALLAVPLAACSDTADADESTSSSSSDSPPKAVASLEAIPGGTTQITLDTGFTDALTSLGLTPGLVGDAELTEAGELRFPITGGNVTVFTPGEVSPYVVGQIHHDTSGLSLTAGDVVVELNNLNVDPTVSRVYGDVEVGDEVVAKNAYLFTLNGTTLKPLAMEGTDAVLEGTKVFISPDAAPLLNETFGTDAVTPELLVGIAKITVATQ